MRLIILVAAGLIRQGLTAPAVRERNIYEKRTDSDITEAIDQVKAATDDLDLAVAGVTSGDTNALLNVQNMATALGGVITTAIQKVEDSPEVDLIGALGVQGSGSALQDSLVTTTGDLVDKKPIFDEAGVSSVVLTQLQDQKSQSGQLIDAVAEKVPLIAKPFAALQGQMVSDTLDEAIAVYSDGSTDPVPSSNLTLAARSSRVAMSF